MSEVGIVVLVVLLLLIFGAFPTWPYSAGWGYGPVSGLGVLLIIVLILFLIW